MTAQVEVVYALPDQQWGVNVDWHENMTAADALDHALPVLPIDDWHGFKIGVYGSVCEPQRVLAVGDRVELYRELTLDAKEARRLRAQQQQQSRQRS